MKTKQSGVALLVFAMALILGVATVSSIYIVNMKEFVALENTKKKVERLNGIKERLLEFAVFNPEIYATDTNNVPQPLNRIPGPGFFPCPDSDNDGISNTPCGVGAAYTIGRLPVSIRSRSFVLLNSVKERELIWYAVDSRYVVQNSDFNNPPTQRFAPLNTNNPGGAALNLNNGAQPNVVAIIFYAGSALPGQNTRVSDQVSDYLDGENADGDADFTQNGNPASFNDVVVSISHAEWVAAVQSRVESEKTGLCQQLPLGTEAHWFNPCNNDAAADANCPGDLNVLNDNPVGGNWRGVLGCP